MLRHVVACILAGREGDMRRAGQLRYRGTADAIHLLIKPRCSKVFLEVEEYLLGFL